ncbi:MAG: PA0069 family radical SAM protein [Bacteroidetes bacterium]|nr:PA0069 family radical SAM protein [Bacteroidota bacterium]
MNNQFQKGRGAQNKLHNKFNAIELDETYFEDVEYDETNPTVYKKVFPKSIVNKIPSFDIPVNWGINPYQGCEHGCTYCYARPTHEYWGYNAANEFEQVVLYKPNAPELLRKWFEKKSWKPETIMLSGNTDCYQPAERKFGITRELLQVFSEYQNPVGIITKNALVLRDLDILQPMAEKNLVRVVISLTTLVEETRRKLEPRTSSVKMRLKAIKALSENGIPVVAQMGPVIPGLTDYEIPNVVKAAAENGAEAVSYIMVRLNGVVATVFEDWVHKAFPEKAERILSNIKAMHGGQMGETQMGKRMKGEGHFAEICSQLFKKAQAKYLPKKELKKLDADLFKRPESGQLGLF